VSYRIRFSNQFFRIGYYNANFVPGVPIDKVATNTIDHDWAQAVRFAYALLHDAVGETNKRSQPLLPLLHLLSRSRRAAVAYHRRKTIIDPWNLYLSTVFPGVFPCMLPL
jgi:hypothetical protein